MAIDYERLRRLIEEEIRRQVRQEAQVKSPTVLFLICAGRGEADRILEQIGEVARKAKGVAVLLSESASEVFDLSRLRARAGDVPVIRATEVRRPEELLAQAKVVCVAVPSLNTLSKIALGIEDSVPTRIVGEALSRGITVLLCPDAILSGEERRTGRGGLVNRHLPSLAMQGIRTVSGAQIASTVLRLVSGANPSPRGGRPIVTEADILEALSRGQKVITVPSNAIVTPLAEETAKLKGVRIERGEK